MNINMNLTLNLSFSDVKVVLASDFQDFIDKIDKNMLLEAQVGASSITKAIVNESESDSETDNGQLELANLYVQEYLNEVFGRVSLDAIVTWHPSYDPANDVMSIVYRAELTNNGYRVIISETPDYPQISNAELRKRIVYGAKVNYEEEPEYLRIIIDQYLDSLNLKVRPVVDLLIADKTIFILFKNPEIKSDDFSDEDAE